METPDEKATLIEQLELKLTALIQEREDLNKKFDLERDPKQRSTYWIKIGTIDAAIHKLKNGIFFRRAS